jgi:hypothetical protein
MSRPARPHLVSRVILRRFCDEDHLLSRCALAHVQVRSVGPDGVFRTARLHPDDPSLFEARWKEVEDSLPAALAAVDDGTLLGRPDLLVVVRQCVAIHMARSGDLLRVHDLATAVFRDAMLPRLRSDRRIRDRFRREHFGLEPAGPEAIEIAARRAVEEARRQVEDSGFHAERMLASYDEALKVVDGKGLQVCVAAEGEFLIGDVPAQSLRKDHDGVGPLGGVPWSEATTIVMPIGRRHSVSLSRESEYLHLESAAVRYLNTVQVRAAHQSVAWHPEADFRGLVREVRGSSIT